MAQTIIDFHHQQKTCATLPGQTHLCMWDHWVVTYDEIVRTGNQVTLKGMCFKAWWDAGTCSYFNYYGTFTYGLRLLIEGKEVASAKTTKTLGGRVNAGDMLLEQCGISATFTADPGTTVLHVKLVGTDNFAGEETSGDLTFTIPPGIDPPGPTSGSVSCAIGGPSEGNDHATVTLSGVDFNCPTGNTCHNSTSIVVSTSSTFSPVKFSSSGTSLKMSLLQPNTKYYARGTVSNGEYTSNSTCSFITLTSSSAFGYKYRTDQVSELSVNVDRGGDQCDTITKVFIREKGTTTWKQVHSTTEYGVQTFQLRNLIVRGKHYEAKTESQNCAGTYISPIYDFSPPAADDIIGMITSLDSELEEESKGQSVTINYCWKVTSALLTPVSEDNPIKVSVQYRIKNEGEWQDIDAVTMTTDSLSLCATIPNLSCSSEYEFRLAMQNGPSTFYSAIRTLLTATCADVNVCTCVTFEYMTELICQEFNRVKSGMKTVYANCDAKDLCDPYSKNPTWASILSRVVRFFQMATCILCSMEDLQMIAGEDNQIYTATEPGKPGAWQTLVNEATEGSDYIISSQGALDAINYFVSSVWHPIGSYDYFVWKESDIPTEAPDPKNGETLVMGENWYQFTNGNWVNKGQVKNLAPFGTILIKKGTDYANHEFYWFANEWNLLDFEKGPTAAKIAAYESKDDLTTNDQFGGLKIQHNLADFDYSSLPCERTVCFVVEDMNLPAAGSHRVTFPTEPNATIIQYQDVVDGAKAQKPIDPTRTGFTFVGWKNGNTGATFDWDAPIHADVEVIALWTPQVVTVTFDINGATGTTPSPISAFYGDFLASLPDDTGFSLPGGTFKGWARHGVPFTSTTELVGDTTLVAIWEMDEFDVTVHPQNGDPNTVLHLTYGSAPAAQPTPAKAESVFIGWFTSPDAGTGAEFNFASPLYGPTDIYARYVPSHYTITFDSAGGTAVPQQIVAYQSYPQIPKPAPTKTGMVFGWWMDENGKRYYFDEPIRENKDLTAKWLHVYTVKFVDTFGGTVQPDQQVVEGSPFSVIVGDPTRPGYTFEGWYKEDGSKWDTDTDVVTSDMTLTAVFKADE